MSKCIFYIDVLACTITLLTSKYSISDNRDYTFVPCKGFHERFESKNFRTIVIHNAKNNSRVSKILFSNLFAPEP